MVKANSVRVNMRLRDEARFALEELAERMGCSQTAVVERLVIAAHEGSFADSLVTPRGLGGAIERDIQEVQGRFNAPNHVGTVEQFDPASVPGVKKGTVAAFPCRGVGLNL